MVAALLVGQAAATSPAASWPSHMCVFFGPMENQLDDGCSTSGFFSLLIFTFHKKNITLTERDYEL